MKRVNYKEVKLDPLDIEGFVNFKIGFFNHFVDSPISCSVSIIKLENGSTPNHSHQQANQHELIFTLSGHGILKTAEKEEEVQEGDIIYFAPTENHQLESLDGSIVVASIHINAI
jgi:mannose-6-phosphate isomerase-like protein (cupin superfamily)